MLKENFYIGQIIEGEYTPEIAEFCNNSNCHIVEIETKNDIRYFQIAANDKLNENEIKQYMIIDLKKYLSNTDWYVTRKIETGKEIPEDILNQRNEAREEISKLLKENEFLKQIF